MSDYNTYYYKAQLNRGFDDADAFRDYAVSHGVYFDLTSVPMPLSSNAPSFGPNTEYDGPSFDHWGLQVDNGVLSIGVFASNLEREDDHEEDADGIKPPSKGTRLENLLRFLSSVTDGEPGEIQGAYSAERWDYETHAHPIVRCGDGQLRVAPTPVTPQDDGRNPWHSSEDGRKVSIPDILPDDLVSSGYSGAKIDLDMDDLVARFTPIQVSKTLTMR
ncbi:hypothetical protein OIU34_18570 [Pararhizobium sp. BT-229]|uniref:hypothetical protein n=1 Tax=Pararhizobium sp. BT-229 TaxID=2986923 RepID=UPI0021F6B56E|nr:hypothetical protein [Pararhizobium sp. BT-229]MCV9963884.1 hypothetical protein [Pararhizobium sp. BT-229]